MKSSVSAHAREVLKQACLAAGLDPKGAEVIRLAENQTWRLPKHRIVARIARPGQSAAALREVQVAQWLTANHVPVVHLAAIRQPVEAAGHPVTFWEELPPNRHGSPTESAQLLKQLHALAAPNFELGYLNPFVRISERLSVATTLHNRDRDWLKGLYADLKSAWAERPSGRADCVVHGDAWPGNLIHSAEGPLLIDLERFSLGPPEWDLVSTAVRARTTGAATSAEYDEFCAAYGYDVTEWGGYPILAGIRELRMATYAAQHAKGNPEWADQAQHRVDCLRGREGARPWNWKGII
ncbi:aminoglycoside phosphotransferase family protein [Streptomyces sp. NPDC048157]|uniref:aminoglycoside phosphotransferase family protein n=1 Tax=Streptomyces sp. NPDC048157 TaxID=3365503 RepID=UPI003723C27C